MRFPTYDSPFRQSTSQITLVFCHWWLCQYLVHYCSCLLLQLHLFTPLTDFQTHLRSCLPEHFSKCRLPKVIHFQSTPNRVIGFQSVHSIHDIFTTIPRKSGHSITMATALGSEPSGTFYSNRNRKILLFNLLATARSIPKQPEHSIAIEAFHVCVIEFHGLSLHSIVATRATPKIGDQFDFLGSLPTELKGACWRP